MRLEIGRLSKHPYSLSHNRQNQEQRNENDHAATANHDFLHQPLLRPCLHGALLMPAWHDLKMRLWNHWLAALSLVRPQPGKLRGKACRSRKVRASLYREFSSAKLRSIFAICCQGMLGKLLPVGTLKMA